MGLGLPSVELVLGAGLSVGRSCGGGSDGSVYGDHWRFIGTISIVWCRAIVSRRNRSDSGRVVIMTVVSVMSPMSSLDGIYDCDDGQPVEAHGPRSRGCAGPASKVGLTLELRS